MHRIVHHVPWDAAADCSTGTVDEGNWRIAASTWSETTFDSQRGPSSGGLSVSSKKLIEVKYSYVSHLFWVHGSNAGILSSPVGTWLASFSRRLQWSLQKAFPRRGDAVHTFGNESVSPPAVVWCVLHVSCKVLIVQSVQTIADHIIIPPHDTCSGGSSLSRFHLLPRVFHNL